MSTILNLETRVIILLLATVLTGLSAGLCFTWGNAVTTGIGRLPDASYLQAFQHMNRTIINPLFIIVFFGPVLLSPLAAYSHFNISSQSFGLIVAAAVFYFVGTALVTMFGNVPLNELLDKINLTDISASDAKAFRDKFETKWNSLHLIRTITSTISLSLLVLASLVRYNNASL